MWIFANDCFLGIVRDRNSPRRLVVRARRKSDLLALFPRAEVIESQEADYRFRATVAEDDVAEAVAARVRAIDYGSLRDSIEDQDLSAFAHQVWIEGVRLQKSKGG